MLPWAMYDVTLDEFNAMSKVLADLSKSAKKGRAGARKGRRS